MTVRQLEKHTQECSTGKDCTEYNTAQEDFFMARKQVISRANHAFKKALRHCGTGNETLRGNKQNVQESGQDHCELIQADGD